MKKVITLLVVTSLLGSTQAIACSVNINVTNSTGETLKSVSVDGPFSRYSDDHELKDGESFTYHASGSLFTCHGGYSLSMSSGDPHCYMSGVDENDNNLNMSSDGTGYFTILKEKSGSSCRVSATK